MKKLFSLLAILFAVQFSYAQWTTSGNDIYNSNSGNVGIGTGASPTTINSSSPFFSSVMPKAEIVTGTNSTAYSELMTIRHTGTGANALDRQLGLLFKLSSESSSAESNKQGGLLFESSQAYSNNPYVSLIAGQYRALTALSANGYVGIGTTSPAVRLHISDGNTVSPALYTTDYQIISAQNTSPGFNIVTTGTSTSNRGVFKATRARGTLASPTIVQNTDEVFSLLGAAYDGSTNNATAGITFLIDGSPAAGTTPQSIIFETGTTNTRTERMRVSPTGNVGIGTTNPARKLEVAGIIRLPDNNQVEWGGTGNYVYGSNANNLLAFATNSAERMRIDVDGNIGIGTTDPQGHKLAVNGDIIATKITVKPYGNWPDYVFKPQYHLPSLTEVKSYIDQNQHLPDMPSEQEVAKEGVDLGEIVKIQTKKIEELTLYMIEKDREMKEVKDQKEKQEKRIELLESEVSQLLKQQ
jgi:hypothetical protein